MVNQIFLFVLCMFFLSFNLDFYLFIKVFFNIFLFFIHVYFSLKVFVFFYNLKTGSVASIYFLSPFNLFILVYRSFVFKNKFNLFFYFLLICLYGLFIFNVTHALFFILILLFCEVLFISALCLLLTSSVLFFYEINFLVLFSFSPIILLLSNYSYYMSNLHFVFFILCILFLSFVLLLHYFKYFLIEFS